jgi:hypothetical protein
MKHETIALNKSHRPSELVPSPTPITNFTIFTPTYPPSNSGGGVFISISATRCAPCLCLLSLDGGGVRGLSALYILKIIMDRLNHELKKRNLPPKKPCEVFDLIGGTSTGGQAVSLVILAGLRQVTR